MIADFVRVQPDDQTLKTNYLVTLRMIERLHRLLLDLIKGGLRGSQIDVTVETGDLKFAQFILSLAHHVGYTWGCLEV